MCCTIYRSMQNTYDYLQPVNADVLAVFTYQCNTFSPLVCDEDVFQLCQMYMAYNYWTRPIDHVSAADLFIKLHDVIGMDVLSYNNFNEM